MSLVYNVKSIHLVHLCILYQFVQIIRLLMLSLFSVVLDSVCAEQGSFASHHNDIVARGLGNFLDFFYANILFYRGPENLSLIGVVLPYIYLDNNLYEKKKFAFIVKTDVHKPVKIDMHKTIPSRRDESRPSTQRSNSAEYPLWAKTEETKE